MRVLNRLLPLLAVAYAAVALTDLLSTTTRPAAEVAVRLAAVVREGDTVVLCGAVGLPVLAHLYRDGYVWRDRMCRAPSPRVSFACRLLPPALEEAPAAVSRYVRALEDGSLADDLAAMTPSFAPGSVWIVLGDELRGGADDEASVVTRALSRVLHESGRDFDGGARELGIVRFVPRAGR